MDGARQVRNAAIGAQIGLEEVEVLPFVQQRRELVAHEYLGVLMFKEMV